MKITDPVKQKKKEINTAATSNIAKVFYFCANNFFAQKLNCKL